MKKLLSTSFLFITTLIVNGQICTRTVSTYIKAPGGYNIYGTATLTNNAGALTLSFDKDFSTVGGPDLHVYLAKNNASPTAAGNTNLEVGKLKSNSGEQSYTIPPGINIEDYDNVLIHCKGGNHFWGGGTLSSVSGLCSTTGITESEQEVFSLYPNPANEILNINISNANAHSISITDVTGKILLNEILSENKKQVDVSKFTEGLYFVRIADGDDKTMGIRKFLVY
ncbi:MAG: DM13 domain-containing protein [Bacteroidetes bacterium]|nr:DM13 domain-containing protein [Bacteroidota bacterium]